MKLFFSHIGIPTTEQQENEIYEKELCIFRRDAADSPLNIEYLRFLPESQLPLDLSRHPHVGYETDHIEQALTLMDQVLFGPWFNGTETIAFARKDGLLFEFIQP